MTMSSATSAPRLNPQACAARLGSKRRRHRRAAHRRTLRVVDLRKNQQRVSRVGDRGEPAHHADVHDHATAGDQRAMINPQRNSGFQSKEIPELFSFPRAAVVGTRLAEHGRNATDGAVRILDHRPTCRITAETTPGSGSLRRVPTRSRSVYQSLNNQVSLKSWDDVSMSDPKRPPG